MHTEKRGGRYERRPSCAASAADRSVLNSVTAHCGLAYRNRRRLGGLVGQQSGYVGEYKLNDGVAIIAAAHPPETAADGWELPAPVANAALGEERVDAQITEYYGRIALYSMSKENEDKYYDLQELAVEAKVSGF